MKAKGNEFAYNIQLVRDIHFHPTKAKKGTVFSGKMTPKGFKILSTGVHQGRTVFPEACVVLEKVPYTPRTESEDVNIRHVI